MRKLIVLLVLGLCSAVLGAELESWPEGLKSWEAANEATVDVVELQFGAGGAAGAPAAKRAMRIVVPNGTWRAAAKSTKASDALRTYTTLEFSVLVPPDSMPSGAGAFAGLDIAIRSQAAKGSQEKPIRITKRFRLDPAAKDWHEYQFTWKYADEEGFSKTATNAQVVINTQSSGSTPMSLYVTNVKLTK